MSCRYAICKYIFCVLFADITIFFFGLSNYGPHCGPVFALCEASSNCNSNNFLMMTGPGHKTDNEPFDWAPLICGLRWQVGGRWAAGGKDKVQQLSDMCGKLDGRVN